MTYVIACGDEGLQINEGTRLGLVGSGVKVDGADQVIAALKKLLGADLTLVSSQENDWIKANWQLGTWEQADASFQQQAEATSDKFQLKYAGFLPFADPKVLDHGVKGHMVRPHGIHIANKVCFTLAGGEQTFNLGSYVISAEWLSEVDPKVAAQVLKTQVDFYTKLAGQPLKVVVETAGPLGAEHADRQKSLLAKFGYQV